MVGKGGGIIILKISITSDHYKKMYSENQHKNSGKLPTIDYAST